MWLNLFDTLLANGVVRPMQMLFMTMAGLIAFLVGLLIVLKGPLGWLPMKMLRTLALCLLICHTTFLKPWFVSSAQQA